MKTEKFFLFIVVIVLGAGLLASGCGKTREPQTPEECSKIIPETVQGLKITGARSERNVIKNMVPFVCALQKAYRKRRADVPSLKGSLLLNIRVEFNGEVNGYSIDRVGFDDPVFLKQIERMLAFLDFDAYGPFNSETEFVYPVRFGE